MGDDGFLTDKLKKKNQNAKRSAVDLKLRRTDSPAANAKLLVLVEHQLSRQTLLAVLRKDEKTLKLSVGNVISPKMNLCSLLCPLMHRLVDDRETSLFDGI